MVNKTNQALKMRELIHSPDNRRKAERIFQKMTAGKLYIYGAGNAGANTFRLLRDKGLEVEGFFDRRGGGGGSYCGRPVYKADYAGLSGPDKKGAIVVIAFVCGCRELADIRNRLEKTGWDEIYYFQTVCYFFDLYHCLTGNNQQNPGEIAERPKTLSSGPEKIVKVAALLEDAQSFEVFENFFKAVISGNQAYYSLPSAQPQYFVDDVPFSKGYARFIDCGAFDGDTAYALKRYKGEAQWLALFEPDGDNFKALCNNLKKERVAREQILFPCGVWRDSQMLRFRSGVESASGISSDGDAFIQCVAIDDAIGDHAPTFLKMDIEGAEYEALLGAEKTIQKYAPDLAVSVYHRLEHLWEIPLLIKKMRPEYKLYLRSHGLHGMETILYAVTQSP